MGNEGGAGPRPDSRRAQVVRVLVRPVAGNAELLRDLLRIEPSHRGLCLLNALVPEGGEDAFRDGGAQPIRELIEQSWIEGECLGASHPSFTLKEGLGRLNRIEGRVRTSR